MNTTDHQHRIILWAYPRSMSTVTELSIAALGNLEIFHEPYVSAYYNGKLPLDLFKKYTYADVKDMLEKPYPGKDAIFAKDLAYTVDGDYSRLPREYQHTFLIRDPRQSIPSFHKAAIESGSTFTDKWLPFSGGVKQLYDLFVYVTEILGQEATIIDAYDLCNNPRQILQEYCKRVGLHFHEKMLKWEPGNNGHWQKFGKQSVITDGLARQALRSTEFLPISNTSVDMENIPDYAVEQIKLAVPYYKLLHDKRIRPT
ncbi:uncharacterized protein LOC102806879, partial [Saccoglossus kowalevskii]|uniref:Branched-chain-amino-acid aminotransferase-like protein 2-like n=1 Tax=Saccoglossus kowalevskii TaxID=10224 RepID=A0ABM0LWW8_SACKO|nr:PREDICTED: branched-chain-amino-acid aminotransferase-like protein 2-like [Saccoglossus kowalevskii]